MPFTTDPGEKLGAIAAALVQALGGVEGMRVLTYDPGVEGVQASMTMGVGDVTGRGTGVGEQGIQLGTRLWDQVWTVRFYVFLDDPPTAWAQARKAMGQAINSIDSDHRLAGEVRETTVDDWSIEATTPEEGSRRMLVGELRVPVQVLMTDPEHV